MGKIWEDDALLNLLRKARTVRQTPQRVFRLAKLDSQQNLYFLSCRVNAICKRPRTGKIAFESLKGIFFISHIARGRSWYGKTRYASCGDRTLITLPYNAELLAYGWLPPPLEFTHFAGESAKMYLLHILAFWNTALYDSLQKVDYEFRSLPSFCPQEKRGWEAHSKICKPRNNRSSPNSICLQDYPYPAGCG